VGVWLKQTFRALPLPLCHETSAGSLEVSALRRGSLPRPWGEGGRRPGEGSTHENCPNFSHPFQGWEFIVIPNPGWRRGRNPGLDY
jgi:hypothetical protein